MPQWSSTEPSNRPATGDTAQPAPWMLTGASGLLGRALSARLRRDAIPVIRAVRSTPGGSPDGDSLVSWDPKAAPAFPRTAALEGLDVAVHFSGANVAGHRWTPAYKEEIVRSRTVSTGALARTLAGLRKPPRVLLSASAIGFYGDRGDELLTEDSPPGTDFLARACIEWEAATKAAEEAGIRVVHLRIGIVLTPDGGALAKMLPLFRAGLGGRLGNGRQWMSWIALGDVVGAILHLAGEQTRDTGPVNCVAPHPVTNAEFTRALADALHRPAVLPAPAFALRLALGEMADGAVLASCRAAPERLLAGGYRFEHATLPSALAAVLRL